MNNKKVNKFDVLATYFYVILKQDYRAKPYLSAKISQSIQDCRKCNKQQTIYQARGLEELEELF